jgi:hypothetical protein
MLAQLIGFHEPPVPLHYTAMLNQAAADKDNVTNSINTPNSR